MSPDDLYELAEAKAELIGKLNLFLLKEGAKVEVCITALLYTAAIGHAMARQTKESWDARCNSAYEGTAKMMESLAPDV